MFNIFAHQQKKMNLGPTSKIAWVLSLFLAISVELQSQTITTDFKTEIKQFGIMINRHHISPRAFDDSLSADVFEELLQLTDPMGLIFRRQDYDSLCQLQYLIDDDIRLGNNRFFAAFSGLFYQRISEARAFLDRSVQLPLKLWEKDTLWFNDAKLPVYATDSASLQKRWSRYLKHLVLIQLFDKDTVVDPVFGMNESELKPLIEKTLQRSQLREHRKLNRFTEHPMGYAEIMKVAFFNIIAECFDPHSSYFNPELNKRFQAEVSAAGYTFGMVIEEDMNGNIEISSLLPGGPAWRSNAMHKGDILLSGTWEGQETADFTLMSIDEVENFLESSIDKQLLLVIRKADGQEKEVSLRKERIRQNEDIVRSYVLKGTNNIGYIVLPAFYTDADETKPGCANDVAREILKLKKENIKGIILDLRYNGGGSIQEALDLAGIFIDVGPVCMYTDRTGKAYTLKDVNRGIAWDGPLLLLVNAYSASASEILAAALQDYNRALIVGQTTYGKASGQIVLPVDTTILPDLSNANFNKKANGYIKITEMRVYRITGQSHQKKGVVPDLEIPDNFPSNTDTENDEPFALINDSVTKKTYYTPLPSLPEDTLNQLFQKRFSNSEWYRNLAAIGDSIGHLSDPDFVLFDIDSYKNRYLKILRLIDLYQAAENNFVADFEAANHSYDIPLLQADEYFRLVNESALLMIKQDHEIQEAMNIMNDFIDILQTKP